MLPAQFLAHFDDVRQVRPNSWTAKAHADQRTGSLAITLTDTGHWLIHDFAGRPTAELLAERGLSLVDLFPARLRPQTSGERRAARECTQMVRWRAMLGVLPLELEIVRIAAAQLLRNEPLSFEDFARLAMAAERIDDARSALR